MIFMIAKFQHMQSQIKKAIIFNSFSMYKSSQLKDPTFKVHASLLVYLEIRLKICIIVFSLPGNGFVTTFACSIIHKVSISLLNSLKNGFCSYAWNLCILQVLLNIISWFTLLIKLLHILYRLPQKKGFSPWS